MFASGAPAGACLWIDMIRTQNGVWPPQQGYTFAMWFCVDQFSQDDEANQLVSICISVFCLLVANIYIFLYMA